MPPKKKAGQETASKKGAFLLPLKKGSVDDAATVIKQQKKLIEELEEEIKRKREHNDQMIMKRRGRPRKNEPPIDLEELLKDDIEDSDSSDDELPIAAPTSKMKAAAKKLVVEARPSKGKGAVKGLSTATLAKEPVKEPTLAEDEPPAPTKAKVNPDDYDSDGFPNLHKRRPIRSAKKPKLIVSEKDKVQMPLLEDKSSDTNTKESSINEISVQDQSEEVSTLMSFAKEHALKIKQLEEESKVLCARIKEVGQRAIAHHDKPLIDPNEPSVMTHLFDNLEDAFREEFPIAFSTPSILVNEKKKRPLRENPDAVAAAHEKVRKDEKRLFDDIKSAKRQRRNSRINDLEQLLPAELTGKARVGDKVQDEARSDFYKAMRETILKPSTLEEAEALDLKERVIEKDNVFAEPDRRIENKTKQDVKGKYRAISEKPHDKIEKVKPAAKYIPSLDELVQAKQRGAFSVARDANEEEPTKATSQNKVRFHPSKSKSSTALNDKTNKDGAAPSLVHFDSARKAVHLVKPAKPQKTKQVDKLAIDSSPDPLSLIIRPVELGKRKLDFRSVKKNETAAPAPVPSQKPNSLATNSALDELSAMFPEFP